MGIKILAFPCNMKDEKDRQLLEEDLNGMQKKGIKILAIVPNIDTVWHPQIWVIAESKRYSVVKGAK